jgi:hypothetical protein
MKNKRMIFTGLLSTLTLLTAPTAATYAAGVIAVGSNGVFSSAKANTVDIAKYKALSSCRSKRGRNCQVIEEYNGSGEYLVLAKSSGGAFGTGESSNLQSATDQALSNCYAKSDYQSRCRVVVSFKS